jgi:hypothetical protein
MAWQIELSNGTAIELTLCNTAAGISLASMLKHLQHVQVPFADLDNPYYKNTMDLDSYMVEQAAQVGIDIDVSKLRDQLYLNHLHWIYEEQYDGGSVWLGFHESIHAIEERNRGTEPLIAKINWRTQAGKITQPLTFDIQQCAVGQVCAGDVFVAYGELGKPLYTYWRDQEPDKLARVLQLCAPWTQFKPNIGIALNDIELKPTDWDQFLEWGQRINTMYWNALDMPARDLAWQYSVISVGQVNNLDLLKQGLQQGHQIIRIKPCN